MSCLGHIYRDMANRTSAVGRAMCWILHRYDWERVTVAAELGGVAISFVRCWKRGRLWGHR